MRGLPFIASVFFLALSVCAAQATAHSPAQLDVHGQYPPGLVDQATGRLTCVVRSDEDQASLANATNYIRRCTPDEVTTFRGKR